MRCSGPALRSDSGSGGGGAPSDLPPPRDRWIPARGLGGHTILPVTHTAPEGVCWQSSPAPACQRLAYAPDLDGAADPGEVVWTRVPFREDPTRSKDRPVLVIGRSAGHLLGLMLTSRDHEGEPDWMCVGSGSWDEQRRPSWLLLDRVLQMREDCIRREGSIFPRSRFEEVAARLRAIYGWE